MDSQPSTLNPQPALALIGAAAVVTNDVPDYALMVGSPARQKGWMSPHGHTLKHSDRDGTMGCPEAGFRYKEVDGGTLKCVDLSEDAALPPHLAKGARPHEDFKHPLSRR